MSGLSRIAAVAAAFFLAAGALDSQPQKKKPPEKQKFSQTFKKPENHAQPGHTYWRHEKSGTIIDIWKCAETGLCLGVHAIDPENKDLRKYAASALDKKEQNLTPDDPYRLCGFQPRLFDMQQVTPGDPGQWKGHMRVSLDRLKGIGAKEGRTFGVEIIPGKDDLVIRGWWDRFLVSMLKMDFRFAAVPEPPAPCAAPEPARPTIGPLPPTRK